MQTLRIYKRPLFENDSYMFSIMSNEVKLNIDEYLLTKIAMFELKDINKESLEPFKNRPSLRNYDFMEDLRGSVYTYAVQDRQGIPYEDVIGIVRSEYN